MTARGAVLVLSAVLALWVDAGDAEARMSARRCRTACADEIAGCLEAGNRPRACKRQFIRRCRRTNGGVCANAPATTTSSFPTSSTFPRSTTSSSSSSTTWTWPFETTTTSSSTTTSTLPDWFTGGPIQWAIEPPAVVAPGDEFALALDVGAAAARVEGRIRSCRPGDAPHQCGAVDSAFTFDPPTFAGPPGRFAFDTTVNPLPGCSGTYDGRLVAELTLFDEDDVAHGPVFSPITSTAIALEVPPVINTYEDSIGLAAIAGGSTRGTLSFGIGCLTGSYVVYAQSDADWLTIEGHAGYFELVADTAGLDPAVTPLTAHVTLTSPGVPVPRVVPVTLHVLSLTAKWTTPPPEEIAADTEFPLALEIDGDGIAEVSVTVKAAYPDPVYPGPPLYFTPAPFIGPPGAVELVGRRNTNCLPAARDALVYAWFAVKLEDGTWLPSITLAPAPVLLPATTAVRVGVSTIRPLIRTTIPGARVPSEYFGVWQNCGTPQSWSADVDVPWLSLPYTSGKAQTGDFVLIGTEVEFHAEGLVASTTPYEGAVTVSAPGIPGGSVAVPATLNVLPGIEAAWTTQPPAVVSAGDEIAVAFTVTGDDVASVSGTVATCDPTDVNFCFGGPSIPFSNAGAFSGPPGTYELVGRRRPWCSDSGPSLLRAALTITRKDASVVGPFYVVSETFQAPPSLLAPYFVEPTAITLAAVEGQSPLVRSLKLRPSFCGKLTWTASADVPWITLPKAGDSEQFWDATLPLLIDTTGLAPGLHHATVTFSTPNGSPAITTVPVTVDIVAAD